MYEDLIGDKGALELAHALEENSVLTSLELSCRKITEVGVVALSISRIEGVSKNLPPKKDAKIARISSATLKCSLSRTTSDE